VSLMPHDLREIKGATHHHRPGSAADLSAT
jgi:hypothetical protein